MCLVRLALLRGKSSEELRAISQAIYHALVESYEMPPNDHFQIIQQLEPDELHFDADFRGGPRSGGFLILNILSVERRPEIKRAFFKSVVRQLQSRAKVRPEDVFISLQAADRSDWSFSEGIPLEVP